MIILPHSYMVLPFLEPPPLMTPFYFEFSIFMFDGETSHR